MAFKAVGGRHQKCYTVPGRRNPRRVTARAVGSMACYARRAGVTIDELTEALEECAPCRQRRRKREDERLRRTLERANGVLSDCDLVLQGIQIAADAMLLLSRFVPVLRLPAAGLKVAIRPVATIRREIFSARAANDEAISFLVREAA